MAYVLHSTGINNVQCVTCGSKWQMFKLGHTTNIVFCVQLLQVCKSWEDYLWAFYRVMVDVRVEQVGMDSSQELKTFRQKEC